MEPPDSVNVLEQWRFKKALLCVTSLIFSLLATTFLSAADDVDAMKKLASSLSPAPSGWTGDDYCSWNGVHCDSLNRVTDINLKSLSLSGTLPSDLSQLSQLKSLAVQGNRLSGPLHSLANLAFLEVLYLDRNNFTLLPPGFFSGLTNLQTLSLCDNSNLASWTIPANLTQSGSLKTFSASNASIVNSIPDIFDSFPNLQNLRLSYNNLAGTLPTTFRSSEIANRLLSNSFRWSGRRH